MADERQAAAAAAAAAASFDPSALPTVPPQGQLLPPSGPVRDLDNQLVYALLSDPTQVAQGPRPAILNAASSGSVYLERQSGRFGSLKPKRRMQESAERWKQSSVSYMQQLEGVSIGEDGRGEVWVKKMYGKVLPPKSTRQAGKANSKPSDAASFHAYYLCYYTNGRPLSEKSSS